VLPHELGHTTALVPPATVPAGPQRERRVRTAQVAQEAGATPRDLVQQVARAVLREPRAAQARAGQRVALIRWVPQVVLAVPQVAVVPGRRVPQVVLVPPVRERVVRVRLPRQVLERRLRPRGREGLMCRLGAQAHRLLSRRCTRRPSPR
jgi:hypothetical protein